MGLGVLDFLAWGFEAPILLAFGRTSQRTLNLAESDFAVGFAFVFLEMMDLFEQLELEDFAVLRHV